MKKKITMLILCLVLTAVLCFSGCGKAPAEKENPGSDAVPQENGSTVSEETLALELRQRGAVRTIQLIQESFPFDKTTGATIYPEDFAGIYVDADTVHLVLCLTDISAEAAERYYSIPGVKADYIRLKEEKHSYNELYAAMNDMFRHCRENGLEVYTGSVDEMANGIKFTAAGKDLARIREAVKERFPDIPCKVEQGSPIVLT